MFTVVALNIASGSHRQMNPAHSVMSFIAETWMLVNNIGYS
jgi:hypothetical protein